MFYYIFWVIKVRAMFKGEEKEYLFRKYKNEGYSTWEASDKVKFVQDFLINFAKSLKEKYNKKLEKMKKDSEKKRIKSFDIIKVKSELDIEMENQFSRKFEEMLQQI